MAQLIQVSRPTAVISQTGPEPVQFGGVTYSIEGQVVPVLSVDLHQGMNVYFEHHILLWKHPSIHIGVKSLKGAVKRLMAGLPIFITEATGTGTIAFSRDGSGQVFPLHLKQGQEYHVREHQFLAATGNVDYSYKRVKGLANMLFGGTGYFIDTFKSVQGDGIVWLHGYGNVFNKNLAQGEQIDVEPGGWLYYDPTVKMDTIITNLSTGIFASFNIVVNRFTGPGNIGIQSMYIHFPTEV